MNQRKPASVALPPVRVEPRLYEALTQLSAEQLLFVRRWNEAPVLVAAGDGGRQVGFFDLRRLA